MYCTHVLHRHWLTKAYTCSSQHPATEHKARLQEHCVSCGVAVLLFIVRAPRIPSPPQKHSCKACVHAPARTLCHPPCLQHPSLFKCLYILMVFWLSFSKITDKQLVYSVPVHRVGADLSLPELS